MPTTRRLVATALAAAGIGVVTAPAALAQTYPPTGGSGTTVTRTTFVAPPVDRASLPRTGADVLAATAVGAGALAVGGALLLAGRRRRRA